MSALIAAGAADGPFPAGCRVLVDTEDDAAAEGGTFLVSRGFTLEGHVIDAADLAAIEAGKLTVWGRILRRLPAADLPRQLTRRRR